MTNYDPNSSFPPSDRDPEKGSVGEQYSFDSPSYQPAPPESGWPGQPPPSPAYNPYPPVNPVSSQPVTAYPVSPTPQYPVSPTAQPYVPPPAYPTVPQQQPTSTTSFMSAGRVWATVGIVLGVIVLLFVLLCAMTQVRT